MLSDNRLFEGKAGAIYPFTVTGGLTFSSGATLTAQRSPSGSGSAHTADANSTVNDLKGAFENVIVNQDVNHSHEVIVPDLAGKITTRCQIAIVHSKGLTPNGDWFTATAQQGQVPPPPLDCPWMTVDHTSWLSKRFPNIRIIAFGFNNFRELGVTSYYLTSKDKTAVILIKNAGVLNQDLSIVSNSRHRILKVPLEGGVIAELVQVRTNNSTIRSEYRNQLMTIRNGRDASVIEF